MKTFTYLTEFFFSIGQVIISVPFYIIFTVYPQRDFVTKRQSLCFTACKISLSHIGLCMADYRYIQLCTCVNLSSISYDFFLFSLVGDLSYTLRLTLISYLAIYDFPSSKIISYRKVDKRKFSPKKKRILKCVSFLLSHIYFGFRRTE